MHRNQHFRRIRHLPQARARHLEHRQLGSTAEAVLYATQEAVCPPVFTFELEHHIHNVFKHLGARYAALLGDMADKEDGSAALLGIPKQQ